MKTKTDQNIQRVIEVGAVLLVIGMGLNIVVMQTLGSFDAAAVILGLFLGFWALVLGTGILVLFSSWLLIRKHHAVRVLINGSPAETQVELQSDGHRRLCPMH